jgi:hypothetical protein
MQKKMANVISISRVTKFSLSAIIAISTIMTISMHNDVLAVTDGNIGSDGPQNGGNIGPKNFRLG